MSQHNIYITRAKAYVDIETDCLPDEVYKAALTRGLKHMLSDGMSKILNHSDDPKIQAAIQRECFAKAQENYNKLKLGKLRRGYVNDAKYINLANGAKT